jgi:hypothetical protein
MPAGRLALQEIVVGGKVLGRLGHQLASGAVTQDDAHRIGHPGRDVGLDLKDSR